MLPSRAGQPAMRAVRQGGSRADDIAVGEAKRPVPGDGDVLVRVEASAINPFDLTIVLGHDAPAPLACIPGRDLAGIIESGAAELVGTPLWATGGEFGSRQDGFHAEYAVLPAAGVRERPGRLSAEQAASVGVAFTTAWHGLIEAGGLGPEDGSS
jgi:NADPH:quinone reductase